jgi:hypothetical protein
MKRKNILFGLFLILFLTSCGVPKSDYDKLKSDYNKIKLENIQLKKDLDESQHGADRIIALVKKSYSEGNYSQTRSNINLLKSKHPESPKNADFQILLKKIDKIEAEQKRQQELKEQEKIRIANHLANLNNTGMWDVYYYTDQFGDKTKEKYIGNINLIDGTFSNSATQDSPLKVQFLNSNSSDISFQLYEYAGNNPVKAYSETYYTVGIKDNQGRKYSLQARNTSDRLTFDEENSRKVHKILMIGGQIQFWIQQVDNEITQYKFTIENADYYENAFEKSKEK